MTIAGCVSELVMMGKTQSEMYGRCVLSRSRSLLARKEGLQQFVKKEDENRWLSNMNLDWTRHWHLNHLSIININICKPPRGSDRYLACPSLLPCTPSQTRAFQIIYHPTAFKPEPATQPDSPSAPSAPSPPHSKTSASLICPYTISKISSLRRRKLVW